MLQFSKVYNKTQMINRRNREKCCSLTFRQGGYAMCTRLNFLSNRSYSRCDELWGNSTHGKTYPFTLAFHSREIERLLRWHEPTTASESTKSDSGKVAYDYVKMEQIKPLCCRIYRRIFFFCQLFYCIFNELFNRVIIPYFIIRIKIILLKYEN